MSRFNLLLFSCRRMFCPYFHEGELGSNVQSLDVFCFQIEAFRRDFQMRLQVQRVTMIINSVMDKHICVAVALLFEGLIKIIFQ